MFASHHFIPPKHLRAECRLGQLVRYLPLETMPESPSDQQFKRITCEIVETQGIVLVDDAGCQRASLSCQSATDSEPGHTVCHLFDKSGVPKMSLQVLDNEGQQITLFNPDNNSPAISISSKNGKGNGITITNGDGFPLISIGIHGQSSQLAPNTTEFTISDQQQSNKWSLINGTQANPEDGK